MCSKLPWGIIGNCDHFQVIFLGVFLAAGLMGILSILSGNQKIISSDYTPQINYYLSMFFVAHVKLL